MFPILDYKLDEKRMTLVFFNAYVVLNTVLDIVEIKLVSLNDRIN